MKLIKSIDAPLWGGHLSRLHLLIWSSVLSHQRQAYLGDIGKNAAYKYHRNFLIPRNKSTQWMDQGDNGAFNTHWVNRVFAISDFIKSGRKIRWIFRIFQNLNFTDKVSKLGWNIYLNKYIVCTWVEVHFVFCQIKYHPGRRCAQLSESYFKQFLFQGYSKIKWQNLLFCLF